MTTNLKLRQNCVNQIFYQNAFFFFLFTGDIAITMLYTYYLYVLHHLQAMKMTGHRCPYKDILMFLLRHQLGLYQRDWGRKFLICFKTPFTHSLGHF